MRKEFCEIIEGYAATDSKIVFLTGDVGFKALEGVQELLGERFINMGVAEQNMVSVAAGMAMEGYKVFCYSIAPFIVYRCLEQTRNDVCLHNLPVFLVGNGGGYGYGIMGATHHAIEDMACLSGLPNMTTYAPAYNEDIRLAVGTILEKSAPAYLRLGLSRDLGKKTKDFFYSVINGSRAKVTVAALGPAANAVTEAVERYGLTEKAAVFAVTAFPYKELPIEFVKSLEQTQNLVVVEEHVRQGGLGQSLAADVLEKGIKLKSFASLTAQGYPNQLYGNQQYHQQLSGIDAESIGKLLKSF